MMIRVRSAGRALSIAGTLLRRVACRTAQSASSKAPAIEVTLFRLVLVLPGVRLERRSKP